MRDFAKHAALSFVFVMAALPCCFTQAQEPLRVVRAHLGTSDSADYVEDVMRGAGPEDHLAEKMAFLRGDVITALIVASNFERASSGWVEVTADFEWVRPDGSTMSAKDKFSQIQGNPPEGSNWAILNPVLELGFGETDTPGVYMFRLTITDEVSGRSDSVQVPLVLVTDPARKKVLNLEISNGKALEDLWTDFTAHRDELPIRRIITSLSWAEYSRGGQKMLGESARASLVSKARMMGDLLAICEKLVPEVEGRTRVALEAVIEEVKSESVSQ